MGEASRRQKLDPNYGKVPALRTQSLKYKHLQKICSELLKQFDQEFNALFDAETVPENYQTVKEEVRLWLKNKLSIYREADRAELAKLIFFTLVGVKEFVSSSPLAVSCIFKAVKDFFTPGELQGFLDNLEQKFGTESQSYITDPCAKFAFEEILARNQVISCR